MSTSTVPPVVSHPTQPPRKYSELAALTCIHYRDGVCAAGLSIVEATFDPEAPDPASRMACFASGCFGTSPARGTCRGFALVSEEAMGRARERERERASRMLRLAMTVADLRRERGTATWIGEIPTPCPVCETGTVMVRFYGSFPNIAGVWCSTPGCARYHEIRVMGDPVAPEASISLHRSLSAPAAADMRDQQEAWRAAQAQQDMEKAKEGQWP